MVITTYSSKDDMIDKLQQLKGKSKLKCHQNISKFYDEMDFIRRSKTFPFEQGPSVSKVECIHEIFHTILLIMKFYKQNLRLRI